MNPRAPKPPAVAPSSAPSEMPTPADEFLRITAHIPEEVSDLTGAPAETPKEEASQSLITPELVRNALTPTFETIFLTVAKFRGEHWRLEDFQTSALVTGWTPIVQLLLARLGSETEILLVGALIPTIAIVGGKLTQEVTKRGSKTESIRTPKSEASSVSSGSEVPAKQPEHVDLYEEPDAA
jgi:hypothetical protein